MEGLGVGWVGEISNFFICYTSFVWRVAFAGIIPPRTAGVNIIDSSKMI